jgi:uncharacterized membrane protein
MRVLRIAFVSSALTWAIALPVAAVSASGHEALGPTLASSFALAVYSVSSLLCHQRPERSFHLFAVQLPVCARCVGIYVGAAMAALLFGVRTAPIARDKRPLPVGINIPMVASIVPIGLTLIFELATGTVPSNWVRALSGVPFGAWVAWVVCSVG